MADDGARPLVGKIKSEQDHADLLTYHLSLIRQADAAVETAKGPVADAKAVLSDKQEDLTKAFNAAKADLGRGYSREYLGGLLKDGRQKITAQVDFEKMRARDKVALGQPVFGQQAELFAGEETPVEAKDEMAWEAEGYIRGLRGALDEIQDGDPPRFHQAVMRGYEQGQRATQERVQRAMEAKKAAETPNAGEQARALNDIPEPGTPEHEAALEASAKLARESLDKIGDGQGGAGAEGDADAAAEPFEAPAGEIEQQSTRKAVKDAKANRTSGEAEAAAVH